MRFRNFVLLGLIQVFFALTAFAAPEEDFAKKVMMELGARALKMAEEAGLPPSYAPVMSRHGSFVYETYPCKMIVSCRDEENNVKLVQTAARVFHQKLPEIFAGSKILGMGEVNSEEDFFDLKTFEGSVDSAIRTANAIAALRKKELSDAYGGSALDLVPDAWMLLPGFKLSLGASVEEGNSLFQKFRKMLSKVPVLNKGVGGSAAAAIVVVPTWIKKYDLSKGGELVTEFLWPKTRIVLWFAPDLQPKGHGMEFRPRMGLGAVWAVGDPFLDPSDLYGAGLGYSKTFSSPIGGMNFKAAGISKIANSEVVDYFLGAVSWDRNAHLSQMDMNKGKQWGRLNAHGLVPFSMLYDASIMEEAEDLIAQAVNSKKE